MSQIDTTKLGGFAVLMEAPDEIKASKLGGFAVLGPPDGVMTGRLTAFAVLAASQDTRRPIVNCC